LAGALALSLDGATAHSRHIDPEVWHAMASEWNRLNANSGWSHNPHVVPEWEQYDQVRRSLGPAFMRNFIAERKDGIK
jgi:hypothetical protein